MATRVAIVLATLVASGCSGPSSYNPVDWWHDLEGGRIAGERPPPPNADAPYPNLSTVPPKPTIPDAATRNRIAGGLVSDRANARYALGTAIPAVPPPRPVPSGAPGGQAAAGGSDLSSASLQAANAPPPPPHLVAGGPPQPPLPGGAPPAPHAAPVGAVQSAPLEPAPAPTPAPGAGTDAGAEMPAIPEAPPPPPSFSGVPAVTAPTPAPVAPPPPPAPVVAPHGEVAVAFAPDSAVLPKSAADALTALARQRGKAVIAVTGFGGATADDITQRAATLPLALDRARAITTVLREAGVPQDAIREDARASGNGGAARIVN